MVNPRSPNEEIVICISGSAPATRPAAMNSARLSQRQNRDWL